MRSSPTSHLGLELSLTQSDINIMQTDRQTDRQTGRQIDRQKNEKQTKCKDFLR